LGIRFVAEVRYRAADDELYLLPVRRIVKGNAAGQSLATGDAIYHGGRITSNDAPGARHIN
jgi:hypothetical protein